MLLTELYDYTTNINWSFDTGNGHIGKFSIDNIQYAIFIKQEEFPFDKKLYSVLDISFANMKENENRTDLTYDSKNAGKVFGAVANGISQKLKEFNVDALLISIDNATEQRERIYNFLIRRFNSRFGYIVNNINLSPTERAIIMSIKIPEPVINEIIKRGGK